MYKKLLFLYVVLTSSSKLVNAQACGLNEVSGFLECQPTCAELNPTCTITTGTTTCICEAGFVRFSGVCVDGSVACDIACPPNEVVGFCEPSCTNLQATGCTLTTPTCVCTTGFVRNATGFCEPALDVCTLECGTNEVVGYRGCDPTCINLMGENCTSGALDCICMDGFVRNLTDVCVPADSICPLDCGMNEEEGIVGCGPNCIHPKGLYCDTGNRTCVCIKNYVRNEEGICVKASEYCPVCEKNEELGYRGCDPTCVHINGTNCTSGVIECICKDGFVRNLTQHCVPYKSICPLDCEKHEVEGYEECEPTCEKRSGHHCTEGTRTCICEEHYVRNEHGECVPAEDVCAPTCGKNEVSGFRGCDPTCDDLDGPDCKRGVKACVCKEHFVRNYKSECVPADQVCPVPCGRFEVEGFKGCEPTCDNLKGSHCTTSVRGCVCREYYVRNYKHECVPASEICKLECGQNEYEGYIGCEPTCEDLDGPQCREGKRGCVCKTGFVRDKNNHCVKASKVCKKQCGRNEIEGYEGCDPTCDDLHSSRCTGHKKGCVCKYNYVRNSQGVCVPAENVCALNCGRNEVEGFEGCEPTCDNYDGPNCYSGKRACVCKAHHVRNKNGKCVSAKKACASSSQSTRSCGRNEVKANGRCEPTCDDLSGDECYDYRDTRSVKNDDFDDYDYYSNNNNNYEEDRGNSDCICRRNYVRDSDGRCVKAEKICKKCGEHEIYSTCGTRCPRTCQDPMRNCNSECVTGCFCKPGYLRDTKSNKCVPADTCTRDICPAGEKFYECGSNCPSTCKERHRSCKQKCIAGCFCEEGLIRDTDSGKCVKPNSCPEECPEHEVYATCGSACPPTCLDQHRFCLDRCVKGCTCKPGYIRKYERGPCVRMDSCPKIEQKCGENEEYKESGTDCQTCDNYNYVNCPVKHEPRCYCKTGYIRDRRGRCVSIETCEASKCSHNEMYMACGSYCPPSCKEPNRHCIERCTPGCFCKPGYIRDDNTGMCVPSHECKKECPRHEVFRKCGPLCEPTCDDRWPHCRKGCSEGCFCEEGYVREHDDGECIRESSCPSKNCGKNEVYKPAGSDCATCDNYNYVKCELEYKAKCYCRQGFVRDRRGNCVSTVDCHKGSNIESVTESRPSCGVNEVYRQSGYDCATCSNYKTKKCYTVYEAKCYCKDGYVRNEHGVCVDTKDCTEEKEEQECGRNEVFKSKGYDCKTCRNQGYVRCSLLKKEKCYCKQGYVRNDYGQCVHPDECDTESEESVEVVNTCGYNEEYLECGSSCPATCQDPNKSCYSQCRSGCFCKQGYLRDEHTHACLPRQSCVQECRNNEVYQTCGPTCERTCSNLHPVCGYGCVSGCFCPGNLVRNDYGQCVHESECERSVEQHDCEENEVYRESGRDCRRCDDDHDRDCPLIHEARCYCRDGFVRNNEGRCVHEMSCQTRKMCHLQDPNSEYSDCVKCEKKCSLMMHKPLLCMESCRKGCQCKAGYVRDKWSGRCVTLAQCLLHLPKL